MQLKTLFVALLASASSLAQTGFDRAEDPERRLRGWRESMPGEVHLQRLERTGMAVAKQQEAMGLREGNAWYPTGPFGSFSGTNGRIAGIEIRQSGGSYYVYVGAANGGVWRTLGVPPVWESLGDLLPKQTVRAFAVHPSNPSDVIVGTGDYGRAQGLGAGMWRTTDAGVSWNSVPLPFGNPPGYFYRVVYHPANSAVLLAASSSGILRSANGGTSWAVAFPGHATDLAFDPSNANTVLACVMNSGVVRSTDGGTNWAVLSSVTPSFGRASLAICRGATANLALIVESGRMFQGVFRSVDGGTTWSNASGNLSGFGNGQIDHAQAIAIRPNQPSEIYVGAVQLARTQDGGANWTTDPFDYGHADITQLYFSTVTGSNVLWICNDGGIYHHTIGGATFSMNGAGPTGLRCSEVDFLDAKRTFRTLGLQDNGVVATTTGATWGRDTVGDGFGTTITDPLTYDYWYVDGQWDSPPARRVWRKPFGQLPIYSNNSSADQYRVWFNRRYGKVFSAGASTVYSAPAFGTNPAWSLEFFVSGGAVNFVYGDQLVHQTLYVVDHTTRAPRIATARFDGISWGVTERTLPDTGYVRVVFASTENLGEAWAGLYRPPDAAVDAGQVFRTTDFGLTWTDASGPLAGPGFVRTIVTRPLHPNEVYVGTDIGVFRTVDWGNTWVPFSEGLPVVACTDLRYIIDPNHSGIDKLVVGTYGRGVYERAINTSPLSFVDVGATGFSDGTFDYPYQSFNAGLSGTPSGGTIGLRGNTYVVGPRIFSTPLIFKTYAGPSLLR